MTPRTTRIALWALIVFNAAAQGVLVGIAGFTLTNIAIGLALTLAGAGVIGWLLWRAQVTHG